MADALWMDLGRTDYMKTLELQQSIAESIRSGEMQDTIIITEHYPAILFGRDSEKNSFSQDLLRMANGDDPVEFLRSKGIRFYENLRYGGGAAYVGPGLLVVYPINRYTRLMEMNNIPEYKKLIDRTMLDVMHDFGIDTAYIADGVDPATQRDRRDVWIDIAGKSHKIASKGVLLSRDVAMHGFQLYVKESGMQNFEHINPCGYTHDQVSVASMEKATSVDIDMGQVKESVKRSLQKNFKYESIENWPRKFA